MTRIILAVICIAALILPARATTLSPEQLTDLIRANVILGTESSGPFCSGTIIDAKHRLILTAAHCVSQQYRTETRQEVDPKTGEITEKKYQVAEDILIWQNKYLDFEVISSQRLVAKILAKDTATDQALIQIRDPDYTPPLALTLAPSTYQYLVTKPCVVVGNSFGILDASVSPCTIASPQRTLRLGGKDTKLVQLNSGAVGGNSGGAVIDAQTGQLIGTLVAGIPGTTLSFMIPSSAASELLTKHAPK
jgi:S1-C subfamily serine protease